MGRVADIVKNLGPEGLQRWEIRTGQFLVQSFDQAFEDLGLGTTKWRPRARLSIPAIVPDLARGSRIKEHWFDTKPGSAAPNELRQSLSWRTVRPGTVEAGSNLSFASEQQRGSTKNVLVTSNVRKNIARALKDDKRLMPGDKRKLGWLSARDSVTVKIPARPFVGFTEPMERRVRGFAVEEVLRG